MHKSKLGGFIIDCKTADVSGAAQFWAAALGLEIKTLKQEEAERYVTLFGPSLELDIEVQAVSHDSRVHLDIETDNIPAEVERLEQLGAKRLEQIKSWWVMEAPTGQRFCVVKAFSKHFDELATQWS
jgi:hypothetical protein